MELIYGCRKGGRRGLVSQVGVDLGDSGWLRRGKCDMGQMRFLKCPFPGKGDCRVCLLALYAVARRCDYFTSLRTYLETQDKEE